MIKEYFKSLIHFEWETLSGTRLATAVVLFVIFQLISTKIESSIIQWCGYITLGYIALTVLKWLLYAWVLNPIKGWRENRAAKKIRERIK